MSSNEKLLDIVGLKKYFTKSTGLFKKKVSYIKAVDDVSFHINRGETLGLVGESGCGKSTTGRTILRLYEPSGGSIMFDGTDIAGFSNAELMPYRRRMQMIFQDPYASLNARMTISDIIGEPLDIHRLSSGKERQERIYELLETVGLGKDHASRYPHEFSGGQRQRIGIARALAVDPEFIVCDEPISALDVSIQAQVVNLLVDLQRERGLTYLFIAHDLSMVRYISNRVGVMYLGNLVELAESEELYTHPLHPYTQAILSSIPVPDPDEAESLKRIPLSGDVPSPLNPPDGCHFSTRCRYCKDICKQEKPAFKDVGSGHFVACHLVDQH